MADFELKRNPDTGEVVFWEPGASGWAKVDARRNPETGEVAILPEGGTEWRNLGVYGDGAASAPTAPAGPATTPDNLSDLVDALTFSAPNAAPPATPAPAAPEIAPPDLRQAPSMPQAPAGLDAITQLMVQPPPRGPQIDRTDDARAERGFGRSHYLDGLVNVPDIPQPVTPTAGTSPDSTAVPAIPETPHQPIGDLGRRFARGAVEIGASLPEAAAVAGAGNPNAAALVAQETVQRAQEQIAIANERLAQNPDMSAEQRDRIAAVIADSEKVIAANQPLVDIAQGPLRPDADDRPLFQRGEAVRQASQDLFGTPDPQFDDRFLGKLSEGAGSLAGFVGVTLLTGPIGGAATGSAVNSAGMYRRAKEEGASEDQARTAAYIGAVVGSSEALPITRALGQLPSKLRERASNALSRRLTNAFLTAGEEGLQEAMVEVANNLTAKGVYNPEQQVITPEVGEAALIGAILGGGLGAISPTPRGDREPENVEAQTRAPSSMIPPLDEAGAITKTPNTDGPQIRRPADQLEAPNSADPMLLLSEAMRAPQEQPDAQPPGDVVGSDPVEAVPQSQAEGAQDPGPKKPGTSSPATAPIKPDQWQEIQGMANGELTGRVFMENTQTGEVIPREEFDRRLAQQHTPQGEGEQIAQQQGESNETSSVSQAASGADRPDRAANGGNRSTGDPGDNPSLQGGVANTELGATPADVQQGADPAADGAVREPSSPPADAGPDGTPRQPGVDTEQQAAETSPAPSDGPEQQPSTDRRTTWDGMSPDQRRELLGRMEGTKTRDGALNKTAERVAGKDWDKITPGARAKLEERWGALDQTDETPTQASLPEPTPENFPFADSEAGNPGARARDWLARASDETILAAPNMGLSENWLRAERERRKIGEYSDQTKKVKPAFDDRPANQEIVTEGTAAKKAYDWFKANGWDEVARIMELDAQRGYNHVGHSNAATYLREAQEDGGNWPKPNDNLVFSTSDVEDGDKFTLENTKKGWKGGPDAQINVLQIAPKRWASNSSWSTGNSGSSGPLSARTVYPSRNAALSSELQNIAKRMQKILEGEGEPQADQKKAQRIKDWLETVRDTMRSDDERATLAAQKAAVQILKDSAGKYVVDLFAQPFKIISFEEYTDGRSGGQLRIRRTKDGKEVRAGQDSYLTPEYRHGKLYQDRGFGGETDLKEFKLVDDPFSNLSEFATKWDGMNAFQREDLLKDIGANTRKDGKLTATGQRTAGMAWGDLPSGIQQQILDRAKPVLDKRDADAKEKRENTQYVLDQVGEETLNAMAARHKEILGQEPYKTGGQRFTDMIAVGSQLGTYHDAFDPALNKAARKVFEEFTGQKLPRTKRDTITFLEEGAPFKLRAPEGAAADPAFKAAQDSGKLEVVTVTAKDVADAAAETDPNPTDGQKEAENYKTGKIQWNGLTLSIENAKGSIRSKATPDGETKWSVKMPAHYGRILRTEGADGDHVDFYMGDNPESDFVLVVDQVDIESGEFDEHKVILGTNDRAEADDIYERGFSDGKGADRIGAAKVMTVDQFKDWLDSGDQNKPVAMKETKPGAKPLPKEGEATIRLAKELSNRITSSDMPKNDAALMKLAAKHFGGTVSEGAFTPKDAYDALELGLNMRAKKIGAWTPQHDMRFAKRAVDDIEGVLSGLPTQTRRDAETDAFQQFSTPPHYGYAVNWVANIKEGDRVLEPSAGNGGIAIFAQNAGAKVDVNELAARRVPSLEALGFDRVTTEDAEQIANIWADDKSRSYDVVVMNPPFSAAGARGTKNTSATGARHIEQALDLLKPGGRLVAIMGHTFQPGNARVKPFFEGLERDGMTLQANVVVDGSKVYKKYGTGYDSRILVIDKAPAPEGHETLTGNAASIAELLEMMEDVRNVASDRQPSRDGDADAAEVASREEGRGTDAEGRGGRVREPQRDPEPDDLAGAADGRGRPGRSSDPDGDGARATQGDDADVSRETSGTDRGSRPRNRSGKSDSGSKGKSLRLKDAEETAVEDMGGGFAKYRPTRVRLEGAKQHPMLLVESSAMATVNPPRPDYDIKLPQKMVKDGLLSEAQLEQVIYAGAAHSELLPALEEGAPERRKGYYIGDGTGVGKTREIAGIIADNWAQGRKKHILISKDKKLIKGARRDFDNVGMKKVPIQDLGKTKASGDVEKGYQGVMFTTYSTLGTTPKAKAKSRIEQLVDWVGKDFDGTIIFDEAHLAGNALPIKGKRGTSQPSKQALAVIDLQKQLPNARVVYASATAATEVYNLAYADRLGLWGPGTPFPNTLSFVNQIVKGGIAAMEVVARDMKQMGVYMARGLSYEGVEYDKVEHELTPSQSAMYDTAATAWQNILQRMEVAIKDHTKGGGRQAAAAKAQFWGTHQRFFQMILTSMQMPSVIENIKKDMKAGLSPVIQIVNTNEAATDRAIAALDDGQTLDDVDITPRDQIIQYLETSFPVDQFEEYTDEDGNLRTRPVTDSKGNPVKNRKAVEMRDALVNDLSAMMLPGNPLDLLIETFGPDKVAEVTGRTKRIVQKKGKKVLEKRSQAKALAEAAEFQGGKRDVLIFSDAGGTGMDFHADKGAKNNKRRAHYILQAGWRADRAIQGFGRTHRTNQVQPPVYKLAGTNLSGHKRFTSSIARRLDQLGALTKGQKDSGGGMFDSTDNLENDFAQSAVQSLFMEINRGDVPDFTMKDVEDQLGLNLYTPEGGFSISKIPEVPQFLNRMLNVNIDMQNALFDRFISHMENAVQYAMDNGEFTAGVEEVKHNGAQLDETKEAYRHPTTGATSEYRMLTLTKKVIKVPFKDLDGAYSNIMWKRHRETGLVYGFRPASSRTSDKGEVIPTYHRHSPTDRNVVDSTNYRFDYDIIKEDEAEALWSEQMEEAPETREETLHMVTGALLPIWDRLPASSPSIKRVTLDDGRALLGRVIPGVELTETLANLGVDAPQFDLTPEQMQAKVLDGKTILLSSGHKIVRRRVGGEHRVEIISSPKTNYEDFASFNGTFQKVGFDLERINYKSRAFIPNSEKGAASLGRFMQGKNVVNVTTEKDRTAPGKVSDALAATAPHKALRRALDSLGLKDVELRFDLKIAHEGGFYADFWGKVAITIGNTTNPRWTLGHEALHAFRHMGVIEADQWSVLEREANSRWLSDYSIAERYPDLTQAEQIEEAVAEAFGAFYYTKTRPDAKTDGTIRAAFRRISQTLKAIANWARGLGLRTPQDVFQALMSGEVAKKGQRLSDVPAQKQRRNVADKFKGGIYLPNRYVWDALSHTNGTIFQRLGEAKRALGDRVDLIRTRIQDRMLPVRRAQEVIEKRFGSQLDDDINAYLAEEMYAGRTGAKLDMIDREFTTKIIDIIGGTKGMTVESVGEFLYARHAEERNRRIAEINPEFEDGGSGMGTAEARMILERIEASPQASAYDDIAQLIDDLREWGIDERVRMGLMTETEASVWRDAYSAYVPLKGWAETDFADSQLDISGVGRAYNTRGQESRRAMGRGSEAFNPLVVALTQAQEVAVRSEKNRVGQHLYRLVKEVPAKELWEIKKAETVRVFNQITGLVETRNLSPLSLLQANNELAVKIDGQEHRILINDPRIARAVTQVGVDNLPGWMIPLSMFSRFVSAVNTMLDPEFIIRNFARDTVTANINIRSKDSGAIQKGMMRDLPKALRGAYRGLGGKADTEWSRYFREFSETGGKVSFWVMENPEANRDMLRKRLGREANGWKGRALGLVTPSTSLNPVLGAIERVNLAVDNAIRLSAFVNARRQGMSAEQAASLAKNLTVNFNRRGDYGSAMNAAFVFANAAMQGSHILLRAMKSRRVQKVVFGMYVLGILLDLANSYMSEEDEDGELAYDKIPDWKNQMNLTIMLGADSGDAATIWLPYGYNIFPYMGQQTGKVLRGVKKPSEALGDTMTAVLSAFSPIQGKDLASTLTPTALDMANEFAQNEDWLSRPIRPESPYNDYGPDAYKYFRGVSSTSRAIADALNRATGGNIAEPGFIDISPEYIDHAFGQLTGGAGRFVGRAADVTAKLARGEIGEIEARSIPLYRALQTDTEDWLDRNRYYTFRESVKSARERVKQGAEAGEKVFDNTQRLAGLNTSLNRSDRTLRDLRKQKRAIDARADLTASEKSRRRTEIEKQEARVFLGFNKVYVRTMGRQGE